MFSSRSSCRSSAKSWPRPNRLPRVHSVSARMGRLAARTRRGCAPRESAWQPIWQPMRARAARAAQALQHAGPEGRSLVRRQRVCGAFAANRAPAWRIRAQLRFHPHGDRPAGRAGSLRGGMHTRQLRDTRPEAGRGGRVAGCSSCGAHWWLAELLLPLFRLGILGVVPISPAAAERLSAALFRGVPCERRQLL